MALLTLFEIMEVSSRADLKSDLLQELERQKQVLLSFRNNPEIAEEALASVLRDIEQASAALFSMTGKIGQYLRENDWLMRSEEHTSELQSQSNLVCRLLLEKKKHMIYQPQPAEPAIRQVQVNLLT